MNNPKIRLTIVLLFFVISCTNSKKKYDPECVALNNKGTDHLTRIDFDHENPGSIDSALFYFDLAIQCDSNYFFSYFSKLGILTSKKEFSNGLLWISLIKEKFKGDKNRFDDYKGGLFELLERKDSAMKYYMSSLDYKTSLTVKYPDSAEVFFDKAILVDKLFGEQKAIEILNSFILKHPDDISGKMYKEMFVNVKAQQDTAVFNYNIR